MRVVSVVPWLLDVSREVYAMQPKFSFKWERAQDSVYLRWFEKRYIVIKTMPCCNRLVKRVFDADPVNTATFGTLKAMCVLEMKEED